LIWLALAAVSSIAIALILKVNERRGGNRILIAGANYLVASAISFVLLGWGGGGLAGPAREAAASALAMTGAGVGWHRAVPGATTLALGGATGVIYVFGFLLLMVGIAALPLAVPVTVARLSVALPIAVSIVLWHESPGPLAWIGIAFGFLAIAIFGVSVQNGARAARIGGRGPFVIVSIFVVLGLGDVMLKAFRETARDGDRLAFTCVLFSVAAVLTWLLALARRVRFEARTFSLGLLLGVPNLSSTVFTLLALRTVPASIAFPFINLTVIAGATVFGLVIWRERLRGGAIIALIVSVCAIAFLSRR
jgi:drug/metabolite transporter (DMT)-like permease